MADEDKFHRYMVKCRGFDIVLHPRFRIADPRRPGGQVEIDNLGLKSRTVYVFEGKKGDKDTSQLLERFFLISRNKLRLIEDEFLNDFDIIRAFHYNLKRQRLVEVDKKGKIVQTWAYKDANELMSILRNI